MAAGLFSPERRELAVCPFDENGFGKATNADHRPG